MNESNSHGRINTVETACDDTGYAYFTQYKGYLLPCLNPSEIAFAYVVTGLYCQ